MKGIVMNLLGEMVEQQFGMAEWNNVLEDAGLSGAYTSSALYDDSEFNTLVGVISMRQQMPVDDLVFAFGKSMFPAFYHRYPELINPCENFLKLLESIDSEIHVEVNKLHPGAITPIFRHKRLSDQQLILEYFSARKLCRLAEGLIDAAAEHYGQPYDIVHSPCARHGGDYCSFLISLRSGNV
jgi:predicted hydrocarbon binding protein